MSKAVSQAVDALRQLIFSGSLSPGSDHLEGELAEQLKISRTPVREALLVLEGQGLVTLRPRKGARIRPVSTTDMAEIYDVLTELESLAAADAAHAKLSRARLWPLFDAIERMDKALARKDRESWALADDDFHSALVALGNNSRITMIAQMMSDQVRRARMVTLHMRPLPTRSNDDHRAVADAILAGDAETARTLHHAHRRAAKKMLITLLETHHLKCV